VSLKERYAFFPRSSVTFALLRFRRLSKYGDVILNFQCEAARCKAMVSKRLADMPSKDIRLNRRLCCSDTCVLFCFEPSTRKVAVPARYASTEILASLVPLSAMDDTDAYARERDPSITKWFENQDAEVQRLYDPDRLPLPNIRKLSLATRGSARPARSLLVLGRMSETRLSAILGKKLDRFA